MNKTHRELWNVLLLRNKGMSLQRIAERTDCTSTAVRLKIRTALKTFEPDDISELMANNRVTMPKKYDK